MPVLLQVFSWHHYFDWENGPENPRLFRFIPDIPVYSGMQYSGIFRTGMPPPPLEGAATGAICFFPFLLRSATETALGVGGRHVKTSHEPYQHAFATIQVPPVKLGPLVALGGNQSTPISPHKRAVAHHLGMWQGNLQREKEGSYGSQAH